MGNGTKIERICEFSGYCTSWKGVIFNFAALILLNFWGWTGILLYEYLHMIDLMRSYPQPREIADCSSLDTTEYLTSATSAKFFASPSDSKCVAVSVPCANPVSPG